jgi:2-dehydropantoate 2-reductase
MDEPIVIWGAGAIGGTLGAYLARAGVDVLLVDQEAEHVAACRTAGLAIHGPVDEFTQVIPAVVPSELDGTFRRIVLAVKAHATPAALDQLLPHLAADGFILSAQNGLNELAIARAAGEERTVGAFINFGADWHGPGRILFGNRGAVVVGEIDGSVRERTREMHRLLALFEPEAVLTDDIWGYLFGKLGYAAMLFATALTDDSMADNFADPERTEVFVALAREVMALAAARGVHPRGFDGYDPDAFAPGVPASSLRESMAALAAFNRASAKTHSGIWRDLAVRHRPTEVDAQVGLLADLSAQVGLATPALGALTELIRDVEAGRRTRSMDTFKELSRRIGAARAGP